MRRFLKSNGNLRTIVVAGIVATVCGGSAAVAGTLVTSQDIQDGTIKPVDLGKKLKKKIYGQGGTVAAAIPGQNGTNGTNGSNGANGGDGADGAQGGTGPAGTAAGATKTVVTGALENWNLADYGDNSVVDGRGAEDAEPNGTLSFTAPPAASPLGSKALEITSFSTAGADDNGRSVVAYIPFPGFETATQVDNPLLGELTSATYATLLKTQPQAALDVALKFEVRKSNSNGPDGYTTVVYEPYHNSSSEVPNEWHRHFVAGNGKVWSSRPLTGGATGKCTQALPCPISEFVSLNPNAVVQTAKLAIGQTTGLGWPGFVGYIDDVHLGFNGAVNRYDLGG